MLAQAHDTEELRTLAFDVGLDWDEFGGAEIGKSERIARIASWAQQHGLMDELMAASRRENPQAWKRFDADKAWPPPAPFPTVADKLPSGETARISRLLGRAFSEEELHTLAFDMGLSWDDFGDPGVGKQEALDRLVAYAARQGSLETLVTQARKQNPEAWRPFDADPRYPPRG
jgi:hypothetical protein